MPDPIGATGGGPNSSVYDPSACDPTNASCANAPPTPSVTLEPIYVEAHPKHEPPSCATEQGAALAACGGLATTAVVTGLTIATPLGPVALSGFVVGGVGCARLVSEYYECRERGAAMTAVINGCEAKGGLALAGADPNEVICLVEP